MRVLIYPHDEAVAEEAASHVCRVIAAVRKETRTPVLGLATGSTPVKLYANLVARVRAGTLSLRDCTTFNLDEYVGLPVDHVQSYHFFMQENLFKHVDLDPARTHFPDSDGSAYEALIQKAGGIDLQLLGIGKNGHIGFNEPSSSLRSRTRLKTLTESTRKSNARFFEDDEDCPREACTMGIATILEAREILLMATGEAKAKSVAEMIEGPISAFCPASVLQNHPKTVVLLDKAAASTLKLKSYYEEIAHDHTPPTTS